MRSEPFWFLVFTFILAFSERGDCVTVYLKPGQVDNWNGSCTSTHCTSPSPCEVSGSTTLINNEDAPCDIVFTAGIYSLGIHHRNMNTSTTVVVQADFPLTIESNAPATIHNVSVPALSSIWNITSPGRILLASIHFLPSSRLILRNQSEAYFSLCRFYLEDSMTEGPIRLQGPKPVKIKFLSSVSYASSNAPSLISGSSVSDISLQQSNLQLTSLLDLSKNFTASFSMFQSNISFSASSLARGTEWAVNLNKSRLLGSPSSLGHLPAANSTTLQQSFLSNVEFSVPPSSRFFFNYSTFKDCNIVLGMNATSHPLSEIVDSTFNLTSPDSLLSLESTDSTTPMNIRGTSIQVGVGAAPQKPFRMAAITAAGSDLLTNMIWFSDASPTYISKLTVTHFIGAVNDQTMPVVAPDGPNMTWHFGSVSVSSVFLDLRTLQTLVYTAIDPDKGAISIPTMRTIPAVKAPSTVQVSWLLRRNFFDIGRWYPLVANISETPEVVFTTDSPFDQSQLDIETRLINGALSFRLKPTFVSPSTNQCPNPPYPTGFHCVDGVIVAIGNVNTTELVLPPSTGVILVGGNLTVSGPISFSGTGSTLAVTGCVDAKEVVIDLTQEKDPTKGLPSTSILLVSQGNECSTSLLNAQVSVNSPHTCKTVNVKVDGDQSSNSALSVFFEVNTSKCKTKWIILGTVLGAIVLILVVLMIIFSVSSRARAFVRPFSKRRKAEEESNTYYIPK